MIFFLHCISWCLWDSLFISSVWWRQTSGEFSATARLWTASAQKQPWEETTVYPISASLWTREPRLVCVRAVPCQEQLSFICCWNSLETWCYIRLPDWIASSPVDCFECKIISGIRKHVLSLASLTLLASAYVGLRQGMSWHFSAMKSSATGTIVCFLPCQKDRPPALGHHLLYSLGKGKSDSELPFWIPDS